MPIVEPEPISEVDFSHDHAKTEFSHGLDPEPSNGAAKT
jgi:hypothetical protein